MKKVFLLSGALTALTWRSGDVQTLPTTYLLQPLAPLLR